MRLSGIGCVVIVVPKDCEQKPQLTGDRALAGELADHQLLDAFIGVFDDALVGFHRVGGLPVSIQQCRTRMGDVVFDQRGHFPDRRVDVVEALVICHPPLGHAMHHSVPLAHPRPRGQPPSTAKAGWRRLPS